MLGPVSLAPMPTRVVGERHSGRRRTMVATASGLLAAAVVVWFVPWELTVLVGWDVAAVIVLVRAWGHLWRFDPQQTQEFATREDDTRGGSELLLIIAGSVSLVGVALAFLEANRTTVVMEVVLRATGVLTIALSWGVVHTVFALRYARLYYTEPVGGIDFKNRTEPPDYRDFAYVAFTIGMTFQVSDTDVQSQTIRRTVLRHALLAFLFGAVILATTVNVIASLLNE
jgi:uncharacterized membrane protein